MQGLLGTTLILLAACSLAAMATAAFRVPALLGYLSVGVVLGPSVIGVIAPGETLSFLSERRAARHCGGHVVHGAGQPTTGRPR